MQQVKCAQTMLAVAAFLLAGASGASAECGIASYYTIGHTTASGEAYNHRGISAAHRSLPFGTRVRAINRSTGRSIEVRINDRGPFIRGRIIDLSSGAKNALGMGGLAPVCLQVVSYGNGGRVHRVAASLGGKPARRMLAARAGKRSVVASAPKARLRKVSVKAHKGRKKTA
jgi:rare lipoprotein A